MPNKQTSRRSLLKASGAVASLGLMGSLSGCSVPFLGGDSSGDSGGATGTNGRVDKAPSGSDFVLHVDVAGMLSDDVVRQRANELLQNQDAGEGGPRDLQSGFDQIESEAGFDPSAVSEMLAFGSAEGSQQGGILWTDWNQDAVVTALEEQGLSENSYRDKTVYTAPSMQGNGDDSWVGLVDGSTYALGTETGVKAAIDTWTGSMDPVGGEVRSAYTSAQGGYVRFSFDVPEQQGEGTVTAGGNGQAMGGQVFSNLKYGYGSVTDASNGRAMVVNLEAIGSDAAQGLEALLNFGLEEARSQLNSTASQGGVDQQQTQQLQQALNNITISRDGTTLSIRNADGIDFALLGLVVAGTFALGVSGSASGGGVASNSRPPQAAFSFDYDGQNRELTITHASGEIIDGRRLYVRGDSGQQVNWARLSGTQEVSAGTSLVLENFEPSHTASVVWESGDTSVVLAEYSGPDA